MVHERFSARVKNTGSVGQCVKDVQEDILKSLCKNSIILARDLRLRHIVGQGKTIQRVQNTFILT